MFEESKKVLWTQRIGLVCIFLVFNFGDAHGWGPQGHIVIGYVAELNLDSETKKIIEEEFNITVVGC